MSNHTTHEQATRLKKLGFDMPVRDYYWTSGMKGVNFTAKNYNKYPATVSLPTPSEVLDWFREEKGIDAWVFAYQTVSSGKRYGYTVYDIVNAYELYPTHSEATSELINKLIEILEEQIVKYLIEIKHKL